MANTLYRDTYEHDNCGTGAIVNIDGEMSHQIVDDALLMLERMFHRGGTGKDVNSGDGAGILLAMPHLFLMTEAKQHGVVLPEMKQYAVAVMMTCEVSRLESFIDCLKRRELKVLWTREVPVNASVLGETSKKTMPHVYHIFVDVSMFDDVLEMKRALFIARKLFEKQYDDAYVASFSNENIIYKGMLNAYQVRTFYLDLEHADVMANYALIHSRFSTNTFPSWDKAHPYRYLSHNGEINTVRANAIWANARFQSSSNPFLAEMCTYFPELINASGSDSMQLDECVEMLVLLGYELPQVMMMFIPEAWENSESVLPEVKALYAYFSTIVEPWDGPGNVTFTDGRYIGATLDRNGLRPSRYYITKDNRLVLASEVGVLPSITADQVAVRGRLTPGKMLLVDLEQKAVLENDTLKMMYAQKQAYEKTVAAYRVVEAECTVDGAVLTPQQKAFFLTEDDIQFIVKPMVETADDAIGAMGDDTPLAVFSEKNQHFSHYFRQRFAQVTNPPLDAIREKLVTSSMMYLGAKPDVGESLDSKMMYVLKTPVLNSNEFKSLNETGELKTATLNITFAKEETLEARLLALCDEAQKCVCAGNEVLILSDMTSDTKRIPIPSSLAVSTIHQHLLQHGKRAKTSLVIASGDIVTVHHAALVLGYGANAFYPYSGYQIVSDLVVSEKVTVLGKEAYENYQAALTKGLIKVASKMGVSTLRSYQGAQLFEILGLSREVANTYFNHTDSAISGLSLTQLEARIRNHFSQSLEQEELDFIGKYQQRRNGEMHLFNPQVIKQLHKALQETDYDAYKVYAKQMVENQKDTQIRGHFTFKQTTAIPLSEVEDAASIVKRFRVGAMSYGALSEEAHVSLAKAMNALGAMSNSGEGGEPSSRYHTDANSAIKQVASGRFGVTHEYLLSAKEIQIKAAQGAKPGEGGQLVSKKVYPWIAKARNTVPGVTLISPPPHHDIYSIEDIEQLIYDMKNVNQDAKISVKLVSERGIGTVASGLAKARAEKIIVSSSDGGTGAAARTSIFHTGIPWELGLAETHQTLMKNELRGRVKLEVDGKLMTARDLIVATMLGAEEYAFGTLALIGLGCIMARVCHKDTCPVGIASQNPKLRQRQKNTDEQVMTMMLFIAEEMREYMAELGFKTVDEMIGRSDCLEMSEDAKQLGLDFSEILAPVGKSSDEAQQFKLETTLDQQQIIPALKAGQHEIIFTVDSVDRSALTQTATYLMNKDTTYTFKANGIAGQSFAAFTTKNMDIHLRGEANDAFGKGLSGATLAIEPNTQSSELIVGNVAFFGATSGKGFVAGSSGERFAVRNSGAEIVVEGVGDHGCEYMTGGSVLVLGEIGRNFAAGMSGGIAYLYRPNAAHINAAMVDVEALDGQDEASVKMMLEAHIAATKSQKAQGIYTSFNTRDFVKVIPREYRLMNALIQAQKDKGKADEDAHLHAFLERFSK